MSKKAKDITVGETVFNRGTSFIVKEVRVDTEHGWIGIAFLDTEGIWHGWYHCRYFAMGLLNHVGDVNLGVHDFAEFAPTRLCISGRVV